MSHWSFFKTYIVLYFQLNLVTTLLGLSMFVLSESDTKWSDFSFGILWLAVFLPGIMGFILLLMYVTQSNERKALLNGDHLYKQTFSQADWNTFTRYLLQENKANYWSLIILFVLAGMLSSWLNFIPVSLSDGATIGLVLGIVGVLVKYLHINLLKKASTEAQRYVFVQDSGVLFGPHHINWRKSKGRITSFEMIELNDSVSCVKLYYQKLSYSKSAGKNTVTKDVTFPVLTADLELVSKKLNQSIVKE
ncbi:hypothetical protein EP331_06135 [bacterium]|nr:MAG: hypothetical protein EP331_06135 [bacterium]